MTAIRKIDDQRALYRELMRVHFGLFLRKAFSYLLGGQQLAWNWHLDAIAYELDQVMRGRSQQLLITIPPRYLKSIAVSTAWVAWMLGRNPSLSFVCVSYAQELSEKHARNCRLLMESSWYRELFPQTVIRRSRTAVHDFETTRGGGRLATSVNGIVTGRGGMIVIVDDPIKPADVESELLRKKNNEWYKSTLVSRHDDKRNGATIVVMQRLHDDDLAGMLLEQGGWHELCLPAIATEDQVIPIGRGKVHERRVGDILHPEREGLAELEKMRRNMGSRAYEAQYQQRPIPAHGNLIKAEWLRTYGPNFKPERPGQIVLSFDTASKDGIDNDWSVCIVAHVRHNEVRILYVMRERLIFPDLKRRAIELAREWRAHVLLIEDAASGQQLIQTLRNEEPLGVPLPIACRPEGDKRTRMSGVSARIQSGVLMLPEDAFWLPEFKREILGFPNAKYDDQADALAQLMDWAAKAYSHSPSLLPDIAAELIEIGGNTTPDYDVYEGDC